MALRFVDIYRDNPLILTLVPISVTTRHHMNLKDKKFRNQFGVLSQIWQGEASIRMILPTWEAINPIRIGLPLQFKLITWTLVIDILLTIKEYLTNTILNSQFMKDLSHLPMLLLIISKKLPNRLKLRQNNTVQIESN